MKTSNLQIRVPMELRKKTDKVLNAVGVDLSTAVRMFMNQVVYTNSIPFELKVPQEETFEILEVTPTIQSEMDKAGDSLKKALARRKAK